MVVEFLSNVDPSRVPEYFRERDLQVPVSIVDNRVQRDAAPLLKIRQRDKHLKDDSTSLRLQQGLRLQSWWLLHG